MGKIITKEEFQETSNKLQNNQYTLIGEYVSATDKTTFKCKKCALEFEQTPHCHRKMRTCPCKVNNTPIPVEEIKRKLTEARFNKFTLIEDSYHSAQKPADFICSVHGKFSAKPYHIIEGRHYGCKKCGKESFIEKKSKTTEQFIAEARAIHGDILSYDLVEYVNAHQLVKIICPIHGIFEQSPSNHLKLSGCPKCGLIAGGAKRTISFDNIVKKCNIVHKEFYKYPEQQYTTTSSKLKIICPSHGQFMQNTSAHLMGQGCPKCADKMSKP